MVETISKLELQGRFDAYEAQGAKEWLKNEVEKMSTSGRQANILVDMHEVTFIDSAGLAALVVGIRKATDHGGVLHLFGLQKAVKIIFELSWLDKAFPIYDNEDEAIKAFAQK
ncbi:MAG: STAS domain-containing protein [Anaerolineae bacterium]